MQESSMKRPLKRRRCLRSSVLVAWLCLAGLGEARAQERFGQMSLDELHRWIGIAIEQFSYGNNRPGATRTSYRGAGCSVEVVEITRFGPSRSFANARSIRSVKAYDGSVYVLADLQNRYRGRERRNNGHIFLIPDEDKKREIAAAFEELRRRCRP
jgi:hypothetical protein